MAEIITRLNNLISERFNRNLTFVEMTPYSDGAESPIVDLVLRNRGANKIISSDKLIIPIHAGSNLVGAALINNALTLSEGDLEALVSTVKVILDGYFEASDRLAKSVQLESYLANQIDSGNVIRLGDIRTRNKEFQNQIIVGRKQGPALTQVLIEGSTGSPFKEIALDIHNRSGRSSFVSWEDIEGSKFTEAQQIADLGALTIFIPDLAQLSPREQEALDRYILELMNEESPRIIAAIQTPIDELVQKNLLRSSLLFYFSKAHLKIPPLVDRKEDIMEMIDFFSKAHSQGQKDLKSYGLEALSYLTEYDWPGNEKELEIEIQKIVEQKKDKYGIDSLPVKIVGSEAKQLYRLARSKTNLKEATDELEGKMLNTALTRSRGNKSEASRLLGLSRSALLEKLERLDKSGGSSSDS